MFRQTLKVKMQYEELIASLSTDQSIYTQIKKSLTEMDHLFPNSDDPGAKPISKKDRRGDQ